MSTLVVSITHSHDHVDSATVGVVVANAGLAAGQKVYLWLSLEGVHLSQKGYAVGMHAAGFDPLDQLIEKFVNNGGEMIVCPPCFKQRGLSEEKLQKGAVLAGGARLVELLSQGAACISY
jgi:predicted peroxiredoxin